MDEIEINVADVFPNECPVFRIIDSQYCLVAQPGDIVEGTLDYRNVDGGKELVLCFYPVGAEYLGEDPYMALSAHRQRAQMEQTALVEPLTPAAEDLIDQVLG